MVLAASLAGCGYTDVSPDPPPPQQPAYSEVDGLRASLALTRSRHDMAPASIEVSYTLVWTVAPTVSIDADYNVHGSNIWLLDPIEPAVARFWDVKGDLVGETGQHVELPDPFRDRSVSKCEVQFLVAAPSGAVCLSVALGRSGLETLRAPLP